MSCKEFMVSRYEWICDGCQSNHVTDEENPPLNWSQAHANSGASYIALDLCSACSVDPTSVVSRWDAVH